MPNRVFRDVSTLGTQRLLESNNIKVGRLIKRVTNDIRINSDSNDTVDFKVSEGLRSDNRMLNVTLENISAADSTIRETDIAKKIAILTRKYILETASVINGK